MTNSMGSLEKVLRARAERAFDADLESAKTELEALLTRVAIGQGWETQDVGLLCRRIVFPHGPGADVNLKKWNEFKELCIAARTRALSVELMEAIDRVRDLEDEVGNLAG